jgi:tungstate transport system substrate-binding protein
VVRGSLVIVAILSVACGEAPTRPVITIATTTSVQNSGLLEVLVPAYREAEVRVHATGSGRALVMLADSDADLVISHAPDAEARHLAAHPDWTYAKLAFNRFVLVGPAEDPAQIRSASDAVDAFRRIARSAARFVSRGDQSGTHERELSLWAAAGESPPVDRVLVSGRGMAQALRHAEEMRAYTLSDEATFWQLEHELSLTQLFDRDPRLLNTYAVIDSRRTARAALFASWLLSGEGRAMIAGYRIQGRPAFSVWPAGCPGERPSALPCA